MRYQLSISNANSNSQARGIISGAVAFGCMVLALTLFAPRTIRAAAPASATPLIADTTFIAFDTETTGLDPTTDRVIELAVVKFRKGKLIEQRSWLLDPGSPIDPLSTEIHGITDAMVSGQPSFGDIYPAFQAFVDGAVLIAHNARFDVQFLMAEIGRLDGVVSPANDVVDSLRVFRHWYPDLTSYKLSAIAETFCLPQGNFHRATDDANILAAALIYALDERTYKNSRLHRLYPPPTVPLRFARND